MLPHLTDEDRRELRRKSAMYAREAERTGDRAMAGFAKALESFAADGEPVDLAEEVRPGPVGRACETRFLDLCWG